MYRPWRLPFNSSSRSAASAAIDNKHPDQPFERDDQRENRRHGEDDRLCDVPCQLLPGKERRMKKSEPDGVERDDGGEHHRYPWPACPDIQHCPLYRRAAYTIIITGFSISRLNAPISSAPSAPSMARWSQDSVALMICAASILPFRTTARSSLAPTARIVDCGGLMTAVKWLMPNMPRLETDDVPP